MSKTLREHIKETMEQYKEPPHDDISGGLIQEAVERTYQSVALDLEYVLKITEGEEMDKQKINLIENEISDLLDKIEALKNAVAELDQEKEEESLWGRGAYYEGEYGIILWDKPNDYNEILISLKGSGQKNMRCVSMDRLALIPETIEDEEVFNHLSFPEGSVLLAADSTLYYKNQEGWETHDGLDADTIMFPAKVVEWNG